MAPDKRQILLDHLLRSSRPLSGEELASRLHVSPRMVRNYVRDLNNRRTVVLASHRGYEVDRQAYAAYQAVGGSINPDTPDRRLQTICRLLVQSAERQSVHDLASRLFVSESTLEADLSRARDLFRQHDITLKRNHELVWTLGPERSRRRLVRQLLHDSAQGLIPATWRAFSGEYGHIDIKRLGDIVAETVEHSELELNEFALSDLLVHLTITIDRILDGHTLPPSEWVPPRKDPLVEATCLALVSALQREFGFQVPAAEFQALYGMMAVRAVRHSKDAAELAVDPHVQHMVAEILGDVSSKYLLGPADPAMLLNLALHVQNMILRIKSGLSLVNPLGEDFKNQHPLVHDLAVYFAQKVEERTGADVGPGEVDYLSMHMGMQYMRYLEQRDVVSITLVAPRYYEMGDSIAEKLTRKLQGQAIIERVAASTMDFDFQHVTSDLIVSCVDPGGPASAPVIRISPFLTPEDLDSVMGGVRQERQRNARRRVRTILGTLIDPQLYHHVPAMASKEAALTLMCERMVEAGYTEPGFYDDVMDRERRSSTSFGGEFAIPHSMHMDANATAISVLVSDKGIPWGSSVVHLVFLFALSPDGRQTFRDALDEIIRLLSEKSHITALLDASTDPHAFYAALMELLDD